MSVVNRINVVIDGEVFELSSRESPEHIQKVAGYIDKKIKEIYSVKSQGAINARLKTLFISLNIADDLFKESKEVARLKEEINTIENAAEAYKVEISAMHEENKALKERIKELEKGITDLENEVNAYIEVYEIDKGVKNNKIKRFNP